MPVLPIVTYGHPILTKEAREVTDVKDPAIQKLIDDMVITFRDANGLGIAGPQVNEGWRLYIISSRPCEPYPDAPTVEPTAMINPVIIWRSVNKKTDWESCLSIPGRFGQVPRHTSVLVEYTNREGNRVRERLRGILARVCQHEQDHLDGILFLERLKPNRTFTRAEYEEKIAGALNKLSNTVSSQT